MVFVGEVSGVVGAVVARVVGVVGDVATLVGEVGGVVPGVAVGVVGLVDPGEVGGAGLVPAVVPGVVVGVEPGPLGPLFGEVPEPAPRFEPTPGSAPAAVGRALGAVGSDAPPAVTSVPRDGEAPGAPELNRSATSRPSMVSGAWVLTGGCQIEPVLVVPSVGNSVARTAHAPLMPAALSATHRAVEAEAPATPRFARRRAG